MSKFPRVRFKIELSARDRSHYDNLMSVYRGKFSALMGRVSSVRLTPMDYEDLPRLRPLLAECRLEDLLPILHEHVPAEVKYTLVNIAPIFNICPTDLKSFIILALGVRSTDIITNPLEADLSAPICIYSD